MEFGIVHGPVAMQGLTIVNVTEVLGEEEVNSLDFCVWPDRSSTSIFSYGKNSMNLQIKSIFGKKNPESSVVPLNLTLYMSTLNFDRNKGKHILSVN